MQILDFLVAVNGVAQLWGANAQFLGVLSSNQYEVNSISNQHGMYGGQFGLYSICNPCGIYGGQCGLYSPYNTYCLNPPVIFYQGQPVLVVTRNNFVQTNGLLIVDPDVVIGMYALLASHVSLAQAQLESLTTARQTNAEVITRAMQIGTIGIR